MKPFFFTPIFKHPLWSGQHITRLKGSSAPAEPIGESWEISGVEGDETRVAEGPDAGLTLAQAIEKHGEALVGRHNLRRYGTTFPLLVKFISARDRLSLQVHPDDHAAQAMGHPFGKTEMWYIVAAEPDAELIAGFSRPTDEEEFRKALDDHTLTERMRHHPTAPGQCFFIPAGRIHSIGAGNFLVEIQQASNDTFRVYDYGRTDAHGHPRELHVEEACRCIDFGDCAAGPSAYERTPGSPARMVSCPAFTTCLLEADRPMRLPLEALDSFVILVCFEGCALCIDDEGNRFRLQAGHTVLVPAATQGLRFEPQGGFKCLEAYIDSSL